MKRDIRETAVFRDAESLYQILRRPGSGLISDASEISGNGHRAVFSGTMVDTLTSAPLTRLFMADLGIGTTRALTFGPNMDRSPKFSPDGQQIAFLSDRHKSGDFQLYLLDPITGASRPTPPVQGWIEYLQWSPDGKRILLGVAGYGADVAGAHGAIPSARTADGTPSWVPSVQVGGQDCGWRRVWIYQLEENRARPVSPSGSNIWEAAWWGNDAIAAVLSPGPGEGLWYSARLHLVDVATANSREIYSPTYQLGWPSGSPSGKRLAVVEAICSDRWLVAGELLIIDPTSGKARIIRTHGVDITYTEWRSDRYLLVAGHRRFEACVGLYDAETDSFRELWASQEITSGARYIAVSGLNERGDCVLVGEGFTRPPEIALIREGAYRSVKSFDLGGADQFRAIHSIERVRWKAPDGLEIDGWLLRPQGDGPHPLVMYVHGGPVWQFRPLWLGRSGISALMLIQRGYAVFYPNPRGSAGRGQEFARLVLGDIGGADTYDYLSGLDDLVAKGIVNPKRLGVTGLSYGGFMTSWLITQDSRFAAAVPVGPHNNQVTQHLLSNIPQFLTLFLADTYANVGGKYYERSPLIHAHKTKTPTLNVCGALDRCTPPEEAMQFHQALLENGCISVLLCYPEEGHGIRQFPSVIDFTARVVMWFEAYMPVDHCEP
jgi:dipeptidyl aminopeptidase/acylaminoacyl peptidase